jgi:hypothetical protein
MKLVTYIELLSRKGFIRSMWWQLGILGAISAVLGAMKYEYGIK